MPLTNIGIKNARPAARRRKLFDGGGLHLEISPKGAKTWKLEYRFGGKHHTITLGRFDEYSLAQARMWREECREKLRAGQDPRGERAEAKRSAAIGADTFKTVAAEWLDKQKSAWKPKYHAWVERRFEHDLYPELGHLAIDAVDHQAILGLIKRFEERDAVEIGRKTIRYVGQIMRYAIATTRATNNPVPDVRDAMKSKPKVKHFSKMPPKRLPEFYRKLNAAPADEVTKLAMRWTILTMVRTTETRFFMPEEIENRGTNEMLWRIPADRMKMGREHIVPLPKQAGPLLASIEKLARAQASPYQFCQANAPQKPISENRMLYCLYDLGFKGVATMHGFRGMASTVLNEQVMPDGSRRFDKDWIELQLAHDESDNVRGAYNAAEYLGPRRRMLQWWADYLDDQEAMGSLI